MYRTGVKILAARIGIEANRKEFLPSFPPAVEVKSLLTDFRTVEQVPFSSDLDGYISIEESLNVPSFAFSEERIRFRGPLTRLTKEASDLRFSLWGNQGLLYRFTLYILEKKHRIYNLHACALYDEDRNHLYVITGGAGSGKTVFLLSGLEKGLKLFSTETVHFRMEKDLVTWFMGSLVDNIRLGTLMHHFPGFLRNIDTQEADDEWQHKVALDFSSYKTNFETLKMPSAVTLLFPRIEEGREGFHLTPLADRKKTAKAIFDNLTQKLSETVLLYDKIPVLGFDEKDLAVARYSAANHLIQHESVVQTASILSNPYECWGELLD